MDEPKIKQTDDDLMFEAFFDDLRADDPVPDAGFMQRVLNDAARVQNGFGAVQHRPKPRQTLWARLLQGLGGWGGASALTACIGVGLIAGFSLSDSVLDYVPGVSGPSAEAGLEFLELFDDTNFDDIG